MVKSATPDTAFALQDRRIRERVGAQGFFKLVGARLEELAPGRCNVAVDRRPELLQQNGFFHGGVTAFLIDNATTVAAATLLREDQACLTAEYKLNLLAPATGGTLICRARVVKAGRSISVVTADVFSLVGDGEVHTATALASIAILDGGRLDPARPGNGPPKAVRA
jgi:uncharacterized protein (TIGR00369 family)